VPAANGERKDVTILTAHIPSTLAGRVRKTAVGDGVDTCSVSAVIAAFVEHVYDTMDAEQIEDLLSVARSTKRRAR
jgi:hypothetical protein